MTLASTTLVRDQRIEKFILEAIAGHLGRLVQDLEANPVLSDGLGHFVIPLEDSLLWWNTAEDDVLRITDPGGTSERVDRWFRGSPLTETV